MKRFKLHGNTAYWNGLNLTALNLKNLKEEKTSPIPSDKKMYVNVVSNLYKSDDHRKEVLVGEVSDTDKDYILNRLNTKVPDFLLSLDGKVIGYANLHHRHGKGTDTTDTTDTDKETPIDIFGVGGIVDGNLALLIVPATDTAPAQRKEEPKEEPEPENDYIVRQEVTISVYQKVSAHTQKGAEKKAINLLDKVETFLDENLPNEGDIYTTSDYRTSVEDYK